MTSAVALVGTPGGPVSAESAASPAKFNGTPVLGAGAANASPPVISSPGFVSGTASQLPDVSRDYTVYFTIATGGGTVSIAIGPTSSVANTIVNAATGVNGAVIPVKVPAGWYLKITVATSTIGNQVAVGC